MTFTKYLSVPMNVVNAADEAIKAGKDNYQLSYTVLFPTDFSVRIEIGMKKQAPGKVVKTLFNNQGKVAQSIVEQSLTGLTRFDIGGDSYVVAVVPATNKAQTVSVVSDRLSA